MPLKFGTLSEEVKEHTLKGHAARINAVAITQDGRFAVSGSDDQTLRVWNLHRGVPLTGPIPPGLAPDQIDALLVGNVARSNLSMDRLLDWQRDEVPAQYRIQPPQDEDSWSNGKGNAT